MNIAEIHGYVVGGTIAGSWLVIMLLALVLRVARPDGEAPWFWRIVSVAQVLLAIQLLIGLVLFAIGRRPAADLFTTAFHVLYGAVFPVIVLTVGHRTARKGERNPFTVFAVVGLVIFGLTARGLTAILVARGLL